MTSFNFNVLFSKATKVIMTIFLVFALLSSLYVCTYAIDDKYKLYVFIALVIISTVIYFVFRNAIKDKVNKILNSVEKYSSKKLLLILSLVFIGLEIIYAIVFYYDASISKDVVSIYIGLAKDFVKNGYLSKTIGDCLVILTLHLSLFEKLSIPYFIGMFFIIYISIILNYLTFKDIIGKEKIFVACLLYAVMPSTCLLSFCPTSEIFLLFYLSLYLFVINKLFNTNSLFKKTIYTILLIITIFILKSFGYVGYILMGITFIQILLNNINGIDKYLLTFVLIISVVITNIFYYGISYQWRNDEYLYQTLLNGSNIETSGRYSLGYTNNVVDSYLNKHNLEDDHEFQREGYINGIINNYSCLSNNPIGATNLIINKFYVSWSGNHYSVEMLNENRTIDKIIYYSLLGTGEIVYIFVLIIGLIYSNNNRSILVKLLEIIIFAICIVLLFAESQNKLSLFVTPFLYIACFSRIKEN